MIRMATAAGFDASRMLSFDLETTSANPLHARIVTSALVRIDGRDVTATETLADPGVEIPAEAARVHGISTEKARAERSGRKTGSPTEMTEPAAAALPGAAPSMKTVPFSGAISPLNVCSSVDLPAPFGPFRPYTRPALKLRLRCPKAAECP